MNQKTLLVISDTYNDFLSFCNIYSRKKSLYVYDTFISPSHDDPALVVTGSKRNRRTSTITENFKLAYPNAPIYHYSLVKEQYE